MLEARPHWNQRRRHERVPLAVLALALALAPATDRTYAQTVAVTIDPTNVLAVMPEYGLGIHASVYDNSLQYTGTSVYEELDGRLDDAGVQVLRYPGGGYADVFHFSLSRPGGLVGFGLTPWWGEPSNYGYMGANTDFGNFSKLLGATESKAIITVNTGGAVKFVNANQLGVPTHGGQPQEAAAWVAYANADASLFGTAEDFALGVDAEGNDWKTAGYWAKLRASTVAEYSTWAAAAGVYDARNAFLAIDRDAPVGIEYWEIGNETFGTAYYGGGPGNRGYALNYAAPYDGTDGTLRDDHPDLSPAAYGQQVLEFTAAMKAVDPMIKIGAVLATPRTQASNPIGDYAWSYADLNDDGVRQVDEPYWNDEVLSRTDADLGRVADVVDFVIAHWYPGGTSSTIVHEPRITIPVMINGVTPGQDAGTDAGLRDSIAAWRADGDGEALEIFITEMDGYGGTNQRADGLFAADAYATFLDHGVSNVDWLELHNGSFLSESSNTPNFAYFGIQSVHVLAEPGDGLVATTTTEDDVRVHAARQADGSVAVMVLNMNGSGSRTVDISISGDRLVAAGVRYETNGDAPLAMSSVNNLGNSFSTTIAARTLQVFVVAAESADFDLDGDVDGTDFLAWQQGLGLTSGASRENGDANGDGAVDDADLSIWRNQVEPPAPSAHGSVAAPEPSTAGLLVVGAAVCLTRCARRR